MFASVIASFGHCCFVNCYLMNVVLMYFCSAPEEDASTELHAVNFHAIRGSDREETIVMVPMNM